MGALQGVPHLRRAGGPGPHPGPLRRRAHVVRRADREVRLQLQHQPRLGRLVRPVSIARRPADGSRARASPRLAAKASARPGARGSRRIQDGQRPASIRSVGLLQPGPLGPAGPAGSTGPLGPAGEGPPQGRPFCCTSSAVTEAKSWIRGATSPVQPVWWAAPRPAPSSPWKYSWNCRRPCHSGSVWSARPRRRPGAGRRRRGGRWRSGAGAARRPPRRVSIRPEPVGHSTVKASPKSW